LYCRNVKELFKILTYNIDKKIIETIIDFKYTKHFDPNNRIFNLKLDFRLMKKYLKRFKNCALTIILNFNPELKFTIEKSNKPSYKHDQSKNIITYTIKNFLELDVFDINLSIKLTNRIDEDKILQIIYVKYLYEVIILFFITNTGFCFNIQFYRHHLS
jgi:hypothetical protein